MALPELDHAAGAAGDPAPVPTRADNPSIGVYLAGARVPGLFLTGNYLRGVSIGACVAEAHAVAARGWAYISRTCAMSSAGSYGAGAWVTKRVVR